MSGLTDVLKDYEFLKGKGNEYFNKGIYPSAIEYYTLAMIANDKQHAPFLNRAQCHLKMGQYFDALNDCDKALERDPSNTKAYYRRGMASKKLSRYEKALADFKKVMVLDASNKPAQKEIEAIEDLLEQNPRLNLELFNKPTQFRCAKPVRMFPLNNQYSGSKQYH